jgi:hypothetical protein
MIANLRALMPEGGVARGLSDLTAEIQWQDMPRTLALPYYIRGMTAPRLLLARALNTELGEDVFLTFEGVRRDAQDAEAFQWLGPAEPSMTPSENFMHFVAFNDRLLRAFDRPLGRANPLMDFASATIRKLTDAGATVLVIVTPVPWERGVAASYFDDARFDGRIAMLRDVVETSGGRLIDLHRALATKYFRDLDCHFTAEGAAEMAKLIGPDIQRIVTAPAGAEPG